MGRLFIPVRLVERNNDSTHVQKARRVPGEMLCPGKLRLGKTPAACVMTGGRDHHPEIDLEKRIFTEGFLLLDQYKNQPQVRFVLESVRRAGDEFPLVWMKNHDCLEEVLLGEGAPIVRLESGWVQAFGVQARDQRLEAEEASLLQGLTLLAALTNLHLLAALGGASEREALYAILDFAELLNEEQKESLHRALRSRSLDSNNAFSLFLEAAQNAEAAMELEKFDPRQLRGIRTPVLFAAGNQLGRERFKQHRAAGAAFDLAQCFKMLAGTEEESAMTEEEAEELARRVADPESGFPGPSADETAEMIAKTLKWRDRWVSWIIGQMRVDIPYDQTRVARLIDEKMEDVDAKRALINEAVSATYDLELEGANIARLSEWARNQGMKLVAGRLSRAFGNQSHLLSTAKMLADKEGLLPYAKQLQEAAMGIRDLQTQATHLLHLVQQTKPTPFAQTVGALNHFEEALFEFQSKEFKRMLAEKDEAARRVVGRPDAAMCGEVLDSVQDHIRRLYRTAAEFRDQLEKTEKKPAAYIILLQRLHPAETINLANANLFRDVHPGKEEDLADLIRQGGHFTYSSPGLGRMAERKESGDTHWIIQVDDWVEAIPLFIHERVVHRSMKIGQEEVTVEVIETEVDQEAMEAFFRFHAEFWAKNIDAVVDSEHIGLARRLLTQLDPELNAAATALRRENPDKNEEEAALRATADKENLQEGIAALAALIADTYEKQVEEVALRVEKQDLSRIEALEQVIRESNSGDWGNLLKQKTARTAASAAIRRVKSDRNGPADVAARLRPWTTRPTRRVPSLHILTTESAGMTEGYVQTWIEEEMALFNVIRREGLEAEVKKRMEQYRTRILSVGRKVIEEFGMSVVIEEVMAEQRLPEPAAVQTVLTSFKPVMLEAAKLAVLIEHAERNGERKARHDNADDPQAVLDTVRDHRTELLKIVVLRVAENNGKAFEKRVREFQAKYPKENLYKIQKRVIDSETEYAEERDSLLLCEARKRVLEKWSAEYPEQRLPEQVATYIRTHTQLAKSTARKEAAAQKKLHGQMLHPLNYYQAAGGNKRYNLLYTPSRVNLGEHERDSVVKWRQWVGGADRWAAQAGFEFYSLINEGGVEERPALAYAEIQKTSENALCVTHFAGSNALALLCMAVLEGDVEDMADQMNLRHDRLIPPAGEGYGGYCVPKDGLFLAFVLSLRNEVKLRQMGVAERFHTGIMKLAKEVLLRQQDFGSHFEWQKWAAEKLLVFSQLKKYFDLRDQLLVFHITKIARAVENLGLPWHETAPGSKLLANLAAQWGVEKMIVRAEQVNRFMVFYKAWMIYDALREAREANPRCAAENEAVIALSAEYKPVQDIRYSTGMRLFEILAQTGEHLTHSLDEEGQNLAYVMSHGFDPDTDHSVGKRAVRQISQVFQMTPGDPAMERLRKAFPAHLPPGDIVMSSVTLSSTQDLLHYASDTRLEEIAGRVQVILSDYGLTEEQIRANATVYGGRLRRWIGIRQLPREEQDELIARVGGDIHALVLKMRGPGRGYERDIQGIDVLNTGIPFPELLDLLDDMPKVVALMRTGRPDSALAITDGAAGRARRALTYFEIMLFFAAGEKIGQRGVYRAVGLGKRNIDRLREEMRKKRARAERLFDAAAALARAESDAEKKRAADFALRLYQHQREAISVDDEAGKALREEEKMKRYKKWKMRDSYISRSLVKIASGLPLQRMDFGAWIAGMGGVFLVNGEPAGTIQDRRNHWERGIAALQEIAGPGEFPEIQPFSTDEIDDVLRQMARPEFVPESQRFAQQMLVESSSKAVEMAAREALERRKALKLRAERARALNDREEGFRATLAAASAPTFEESRAKAVQELVDLSRNLEDIDRLEKDDARRRELQSRINRAFGRIIGHTRFALLRLISERMPETTAEAMSVKRQMLVDLDLIYTGREIIFENWKKLAGGYEDIGGLARLAEAAAGDRTQLEQIAQVIELFYATFALAQTLEFALALPEEVDTSMLWKNLTDFFAETINDHWYEYWPWAYARGVGFKDISTEEKYEWAVNYHAWLYDYLRALLIRRSELRNWSEADRDALLGNYTGGKSVTAIGANAPGAMERRWRAYNHLREIAFIKSDGFPLPVVFHEFDPDIIEADRRVNVAILFPVGRTHVSRALREGPTLNRELQEDRRPGANILITRYNDFVPMEGARKQVLRLTDAHLYISEAEYAEALRRCYKMKKPEIKNHIEATKSQGALTPKGIRVAVRFMKDGRPASIVAGALIPFHGLPIYVGGQSEEEGLPATIQSRIYTDLTYDKSIYPQIYTPETGVQLPPEIDWLREWNQNLEPREILERLRNGFPEQGFPGLRAFAGNHAIVLIKGAAESGARNLKVFDLQDDRARLCEEEIEKAAHFAYDVSRMQNVVIQSAMLTSPELWAGEELMERFVNRQIQEWNTPVNRTRYPKSQIYGSLRIVASSSHPRKKYDAAFAISLMSLQVATNIGRGGTLEQLLPEWIREEWRESILDGLKAEAPKVMNAMNEYVKRHGAEWEKRTGKTIGVDLRGVSYGWANYLMLDYLVAPVFRRPGRLVDIEPVYDETGRCIGSQPILQDERGRFVGEIARWDFIHLEPNVGIGLWDRYNLREEANEAAGCAAEHRPLDWHRIGVSDRIVLRNYVLSGEEYLKANFGEKYFSAH